ncbi:unnamed protein product [Urochloa humidicola]
MASLGSEIFSRGFRFNPSALEAATYYLPRLVAGAPLHDDVHPIVHRANVYACEPGDLARRFPPLPKTGHRFFFTSCKLQQPTRAGKASRAARAAGAGAWHSQGVTGVVDLDGIKVGETTKLRYKKGGVYTDWLMDEFSSTLCSQDAVAGDKQYVLCNMYVSPRAHPDSAARRESAAFFAPPATVVIAQAAAAVATKRPAPPQGPELPCPKRMRGAVVAPTPPFRQPAGYCRAPFAPPPPHAIASSAQTLPPSPTHFATPQQLPPVPTRLAAPPSRWPVPAPPQPPKQHMPPPPLPVVRACHVPAVQAPARHCRSQAPSEQKKQRTFDPFEAVQQRYEAEERRVAAPDPKEEPPASLHEDDGWDEVELHNLMSWLNEKEEEIPDATAAPDPASKDDPPAALQDNDFDELCHALEEIIPTTEFTNDC